ncbi:uncharacterized protein LOC116347709 [Contarinia nasturtii]|uniref:uncharacterized protein LOC116347709 n=1 Tax=Contarinia nasturtii TaxID=265458 RepID=UPI0012D43515|nr:uncharacterized protein LOC116347709 [Contarinia nasturtii]XP_031634281.1 uncharacterized protein LOC116347709 [Contarinia nasturtii]
MSVTIKEVPISDLGTAILYTTNEINETQSIPVETTNEMQVVSTSITTTTATNTVHTTKTVYTMNSTKTSTLVTTTVPMVPAPVFVIKKGSIHTTTTQSLVSTIQSKIGSLLKRNTISMPPSLIHQSMEQKQRKIPKLLPLKNSERLLKSFENDKSPTGDPLESVTPSGVISTSVTHANRSLVYREPVTTKDTASITNDHEHKLIGHIFDNSTIQAAQTSNLTSNDKTVSIKSQKTVESLLKISAQSQVLNESTVKVAKNLQLSKSILRKNRIYFSDEHSEKDSSIASFANPHTLTIDNNLLEVINLDEMETSSIPKAPAQKRSRAKSAYMTDAMLDDLGITSQRGRAKSDDNKEYDIYNVDMLPETCDRPSEPKVYRSQQQRDHDALYNLILSEKQRKQNVEQKSNIKAINIGDGSKSIQISNGQLSDITGPIRLLDKSTKQIGTLPRVIQISRTIQSQNAAIASLPKVEKKRKLLESIEASERLMNLVENDKSNNMEGYRRTYSRSKSVSTKSKLHFKVGAGLGKLKKGKFPTMKHNQDWQSLSTFVVTTNTSKSPDAQSSGTATPHGVSSDNSRATSPTEIEHCLSWNTSKSLARLFSTEVILQRNEFGTMEIDPLSMSKIKAMREDKKEFPRFDPSMACGHPEFAGCFNAIIQRLNGTTPNPNCRINDKNPHQYYSTEFKEIIGALVQKKNNNCQAITLQDIKQALQETNMHDRTKNSSLFSWSRFIDYYNTKCKENERIKLAPAELFVNKIPTTQNTFEIGQKLEAIDPQNNSLFCVCTIIQKCGYRIKLRFDGYPPIYDFWVNADSGNIFPAGWCNKTGRELEVKSRFMNKRNQNFEWKEYLRHTNTQAAHHACFPNLNTARTQMNPFKIGMKLEAEDTKNTNRLCVATIGDVIDSRVLVTLDGFDSCFNYWTDIRSPYIHPINFHQEGGWSITSPPNWRMSPFSWETYLRMNRAESVPKFAFHTRKPKPFSVGMALEVVDKKNPSLIRPAIITNIDEYHIKVLFIGWPEKYAYWIEDDSTDIYPPNFCQKTGHPIECPLDDYIYEIAKNSCGTKGCRGIGNGKQLDTNTHSTLDECPYETINWSSEENRPNRIDRKHKSINNAFNIGAGPSHKVSVNPAFEQVQVSLQKTLNPAELAAMSSKDVEIFRRLQVSSQFLLENRKTLSDMRDQWIERVKPLQMVQVLAAKKNPLNWSIDEVVTFVSNLPNCSSLGPKFIENEIDGLAFLSLRQSDMIDIMGLTVGSAIKIFNRIVLLREECNTHYIRYS